MVLMKKRKHACSSFESAAETQNEKQKLIQGGQVYTVLQESFRLIPTENVWSLPDQVSNVPIGFRRQRADYFHSLFSYNGNLMLKDKTQYQFQPNNPQYLFKKSERFALLVKKFSL